MCAKYSFYLNLRLVVLCSTVESYEALHYKILSILFSSSVIDEHSTQHCVPKHPESVAPLAWGSEFASIQHDRLSYIFVYLCYFGVYVGYGRVKDFELHVFLKLICCTYCRKYNHDWFITVPKYLKFVTFTENLLSIWICPASIFPDGLLAVVFLPFLATRAFLKAKLESNKDKAFSASDHFVWQCITRCGGGGGGLCLQSHWCGCISTFPNIVTFLLLWMWVKGVYFLTGWLILLSVRCFSSFLSYRCFI